MSDVVRLSHVFVSQVSQVAGLDLSVAGVLRSKTTHSSKGKSEMGTIEPRPLL